MTAAPYDLVVAGPAAATLADKLPEAVAAAVIELITGPLLEAPRRIGVPLRDELEGLWSARRGTYRVVYRIDDADRTVEVLRIAAQRVIWHATPGQVRSLATDAGAMCCDPAVCITA